MELQAQVKINHWQTKGIARHEAFGNFYDDLTPLIDDFVEQSMGKYGRFTLEDETKTIQLSNYLKLILKDWLILQDKHWYNLQNN